jgi:hypothetical protein
VDRDKVGVADHVDKGVVLGTVHGEDLWRRGKARAAGRFEIRLYVLDFKEKTF